jgi:hypothetical protein
MKNVVFTRLYTTTRSIPLAFGSQSVVVSMVAKVEVIQVFKALKTFSSLSVVYITWSCRSGNIDFILLRTVVISKKVGRQMNLFGRKGDG